LTTFAATGALVDLRIRLRGFATDFFFGGFDGLRGGLLGAAGFLRFSSWMLFSSFSDLARTRFSALTDFPAWPSALLADFFVDLASFRASLSFNFAAFAALFAVCAAFSSCVALARAFSNSLRALVASDDKFMMILIADYYSRRLKASAISPAGPVTQ